MSYCKHCGNPLAENSQFCSKCGKSTSEEHQTTRTLIFDGEIHKCPNCGEILKSFTSNCPSCGFEIRNSKASCSISELVRKIEELDLKNSEASHKSKDDKLSPFEEQKISLIKNFPISNTKEEILEFIILSSSHILNTSSHENMDTHDVSLQEKLQEAWRMKFEQAYNKAKICIKNQADFAEIQHYYDKTIIIPKQERNKKIKRTVFISIFIPLISIFAITMLILGVTGAFNCQSDTIKVGISFSDLQGQNYNDAIEFLEKQGFSNIEARDDGWNLFHKSNTVKNVTIDGKDEFYAYSRFPKDAKIIIFYYS